MNATQKKRLLVASFSYLLVGALTLAYFAVILYSEKAHARDRWDSYLSDSPQQAQIAADLSVDAKQVTVGTYVESIRELNLKSSYYRVEFMVWFDWEGDPDLDPAHNFRVYKGLVNKQVLLDEFHDGDKHYQLVGMDVSVSNKFDTKRFPLESHQLRFYVESTDPIQEVVFVADRENSGINRSISIVGYEFLQHDIGEVSYLYDSTHGNPMLDSREMTSEIVTAFEINRSGTGVYFKCFIALLGTITWALLALFICTYHHVDTLSMISGALFGTVGNIMIGASLVPDALEMGLMEYVNIWGVMTIMGIAVAIIIINRVRQQMSESKAYIRLLGRTLFYIMVVFALAGQIVLPLVAYIR